MTDTNKNLRKKLDRITEDLFYARGDKKQNVQHLIKITREIENDPSCGSYFQETAAIFCARYAKRSDY